MLETGLSYVFSSQWRVLPICLVLLVAVTELGYRFGLKLHQADDGVRKGQIAGIQGAILGLLALLLGLGVAPAWLLGPADAFLSVVPVTAQLPPGGGR